VIDEVKAESGYPEDLSYIHEVPMTEDGQDISRVSRVDRCELMFFSCFQRPFQRRRHGLDERSRKHGSSDGRKQQRNKNRVTD
jgi:hypothetical protein